MKKIALAVLLSAVIAAPAMAADAYVGVNAGQTTSGYTGYGTGTGFGILGGYNFSDNLAAELGYTTSGEMKNSGTGKVNSTVISLSAVYSLPVSSAVALQAKLGYASTAIAVTGFTGASAYDNTSAGVTYGIGAQYDVSKTVGVRLGYDAYTSKTATVAGDSTSGEVKNASVISLGAVFKM